MPAPALPDYVLIGHMTRDLLPDGSVAPGGTSFYASLTARRLGKQVGVVSARADLPPDWPQDIQLAVVEGQTPPTFENRYTPEGRQQILHHAADPINIPAIPAAWRVAPVIHLGPILQETPETLVDLFPGALIGLTPQGLMRSWGELPGSIAYQPWRPSEAFLRRIDVLVLSIEDVRLDATLADAYAQVCRMVVLTHGARGATMFLNGEPHPIEAFAATECDPTGAGDVFTAAFLLRLYECGDPFIAARFASYVAARSVEGRVASTIPERGEVDRFFAGGD